MINDFKYIILISIVRFLINSLYNYNDGYKDFNFKALNKKNDIYSSNNNYKYE